MKTYRALVDSYGEVCIFRNVFNDNKARLIKDLRGVGDQVNPKHVKETASFNDIVQHPNYDENMWKLQSIPKEDRKQ